MIVLMNIFSLKLFYRFILYVLHNVEVTLLADRTSISPNSAGRS